MSSKAPARTVGDLLAEGASADSGRVAIKDRAGRSRTYGHLEVRANRLANAMLGSGLRAGDRVATWMEDCLEYIEVYLAAAKAGIVVVPINARFKAAEAVHPVTDSGARALIWTRGLEAEVAALKVDATLSDRERLTLISSGALEGMIDQGSEAPPPPPGPDDLYIIGYTSGTTGVPKGALLTHRSVLAIARLNSLSYRLPAHSVAALTGSMSFVATVPSHIISHLHVRGTSVLMGRWDVESLLATIAAERVSFTYIPSPLIADFTGLAAEHRDKWQSTLRSLLHSASRAEPEKLSQLAEVVGDRFVEGWGMTENSGGLITATSVADVSGGAGTRNVFATVGRAVPESEVRLLDEAGNPAAHDGNVIGELAIKSPALAAGYWNLPEESKAAFQGGWYRTGDLGTIDADGYVTIQDRRTDLIVSGGMNVYPSEVERCIGELPGIRECAVVGASHGRWGQTVVAVVVPEESALRASSVEIEHRVVEHCRKRLAGFKKPTAVLVTGALPRTTSQKVRREEIRRRVEAGSMAGA